MVEYEGDMPRTEIMRTLIKAKAELECVERELSADGFRKHLGSRCEKVIGYIKNIIDRV